MNRDRLQQAIEGSWSKATAHHPKEWKEDNPARGQCAITALLVQDYFGGEIERVQMQNGDKKESHFRNVIDGEPLDWTASQYNDKAKEVFSEVVSRESVINEDSLRRYRVLKRRVLLKRWSPLAMLSLGLLWVYQHTLSPDHGPLKVLFPNGACCYYPSCSEYAKGSVQKYGTIRSIPKIIWRVLRCHPFATPRVDKP